VIDLNDRPDRYDLAVVGGGIVGAAVAFHASRLGARVVVLDQRSAPSATERSSGIVRVHQPDMTLVPLSYMGWLEYRHWSEVVDRPSTFRAVGCVHDVTHRHDSVEADVRALQSMGWACRLVDAHDLHRLFPDVAWRPGTVAVYEPDAGFCDATACRDQYLAGVDVRRGYRVREILVAGGEVSGVATDDGVIRAARVVVATGAWTAVDGLLDGLALPVRPRRILWQGAAGAFPHLPCYVREGPDALYFRPNPRRGLRFGVGCPDWDVHPAQAVEGVDDDLLARGRARVSQAVGPLHGHTEVVAAVDGYTPDERPVVDAWPEVDGLFVAAGFSGGGFKMAPAVGSLLAQWVVAGSQDPLLRPYSLARLRTPAAAEA
jgi:sarcosine oxidase subunit beta